MENKNHMTDSEMEGYVDKSEDLWPLAHNIEPIVEDEVTMARFIESMDRQEEKKREETVNKFKEGLKNLILENEIGFIERDLFLDEEYLQTELYLQVDEYTWTDKTFHEILSDILFEIEDEKGYTETN